MTVEQEHEVIVFNISPVLVRECAKEIKHQAHGKVKRQTTQEKT